MNNIDFFILIFLFIGVLLGFVKGFVRELLSFMLILVLLFLSKWISPIVSSILEGVFSISNNYSLLLSYLFTIVGAYIIFKMLGHLFTNLVQNISLGSLNRLLGAFLGGLKHALLLGFILKIVMSSALFKTVFEQKSLQKSKLYPQIHLITSFVWGEIHERIK